MFKSYFSILLAVLFFKALFLFFWIQGGFIGLGPDEAQYWTWTRELSLGYYSKPPGIAWQIGLGTLFLGDTELGVRFLSLIFGFFLPIAIYRLGIESGFSERASFLGALAFALSPLGFLSSFFAITDVGSTLFMTLAFLVLMKGFHLGDIDYRKAGVFVALGALFKWVTYYFWIFALPTLFLKKGKPQNFFLGILISSIGLLPSLFWNIQHGFVTFLHVYYQARSKGDLAPNPELISWKSFLNFLGAEIALVSPLLFLLLMIALFRLLKGDFLEKETRFLGFCTLATLITFSLLSFFMKIQGNWCDFIYPVAFCFLGKAFDYDRGRKLLYLSSFFSLILTLYLFMTPLLENTSLSLPYKNNPFKHNLGWHSLKSALVKAGYKEDKHFLFAPKYQTVSILTFYGPHKKKAYFFNLFGDRLNQYSFSKGMKEEKKGEDGFFVVIENSPHLEEERRKIEHIEELLKPYFDRVSFVGEYPLYFSRSEPVKGAFLFFAEGFQGKEPKTPIKY